MIKQLKEKKLYYLKMQKINTRLMKDCLSKLMIVLHQQCQSRIYDSQKIIQIVSDNMQRYPLQQVEHLQLHLQVFIKLLVSSPHLWIEMLINQQIHTESKQTINFNKFRYQIYNKIVQKGSLLTPYCLMFAQTVKKQIFQFIEMTSILLCYQFNRGCLKILKNMQNVTKSLNKLSYVNIYVLYKMLRDVSIICMKRIKERCQKSIFMNCEEVSQIFARYVMQKFEVIKMEVRKEMKQDRVQVVEKELEQRVKLSSKVSWREATRQDGQNGILIQLINQQKQGSKMQNYMIKLNKQGEMVIVNANSLTKKWSVSDEVNENNVDILRIMKDKEALLEQIKRNKLSNKSSAITTYHLNSIGNNLGQCLANMQRYNNVGEFMSDLSTKVAVGGSFNYMLLTIPIISYIFVAGGFTYSFYYIFNDRIKNSQKKLQTLGNVTIDVSSSIGSGLIGLMIGQTLIPVPVLGAFVGGVIGGVIGHTGGKALNNLIDNIRFKTLIKQLHQTLKQGGYWQSSKDNIERIGVSLKHFQQSTPSQFLNDIQGYRIWLTLLCFIFVTYDQTKKRQRFIDTKLKQLKQKNIEIDKNSVQDLEQFQSSQSIMKIIHYLEAKQVIILKYSNTLEQLMSELFSQIA